MPHQFRALIAFLLLSACAPYAKGPVFTQENAEKTFQPVIEFMDIKPGMAVADVGAGSGALTVIMATQLDSCAVYIQDIDPQVLEQENVNKMIAYYSGQLGYELGERNQFHLVYGTTTQSNLPDGSMDVIYSNATMHVFDAPDAMLQDLRQKLKPTGKIFIRDGFRGDHGEGEFCSSSKCAKCLLSVDEFLAMMEKTVIASSNSHPTWTATPCSALNSVIKTVPLVLFRLAEITAHALLVIGE